MPAKVDDRVGRLALRLIAANARLTALAMVSAVALIVLGAWTYIGVKDSLREVRVAGLESVLDAEAEALEIWISDRRTLVSVWADDPTCAKTSKRCSKSRAAVARVICGMRRNAHARGRAQARAQAGRRDRLNVVDPNAPSSPRRLASTPAAVESGIVPRARRRCSRQPAFIRPISSRTHRRARQAAFRGPVIGFDAPYECAGEGSRALGCAHYADAQFKHILEAAKPGVPARWYAFGPDGVMLSESRLRRRVEEAACCSRRTGRERHAARATSRSRRRSFGRPPARARARGAPVHAARGAGDRGARQGRSRAAPRRDRRAVSQLPRGRGDRRVALALGARHRDGCRDGSHRGLRAAALSHARVRHSSRHAGHRARRRRVVGVRRAQVEAPGRRRAHARSTRWNARSAKAAWQRSSSHATRC